MIGLKLEISNLIKPVIDSLEIVYQAGKDVLKLGVKDYLEMQTTKFYVVNTFYHRNEKVKFFDIYQELVAWNSYHSTDFKDLFSAFSQTNYISIIGRAGSGKSTLTKFIFLSAIRCQFKIPIIVQLRNFNQSNKTLSDYIIDRFLKGNIKENDSLMELSLSKGNYLFILDGYDEVISSKQHKLNSELVEFIENNKNNYFILTSRPGGGAEQLPYLITYKIKPFSKNDIVSFIRKVIISQERRRLILADIKILNQENSTFNVFKSYLSNPLLLSMFLKTYEFFPELPSNKQIFYRNIFDTLYSFHDSLDNSGLVRERKSGLRRSDFENFLKAYCYTTYFRQELVFTRAQILNIISKICKSLNIKCDSTDMLYDLTTSIGIMIEEGNRFTFPHRSLQEYFCALFIHDLPDNKKDQVYEKYRSLLMSNSNYGEYNFWEICSEVDTFSFNSLFAIKSISYILDEFKKSSSFVSLFKMFDFILEPIDEMEIMGGILLEKNAFGLSNKIYNKGEKGFDKLVKLLKKDSKGRYLDEDDVLKIIYVKVGQYQIRFAQNSLNYKLLTFFGYSNFSIVESILNSSDNAIESIGYGFMNSNRKRLRPIVLNRKNNRAVASIVNKFVEYEPAKIILENSISGVMENLERNQNDNIFSVDSLLNI